MPILQLALSGLSEAELNDVGVNVLQWQPADGGELTDLPIKTVGNSTIYLRDVAHVRDGFWPQLNVVARMASAARSSRWR